MPDREPEEGHSPQLLRALIWSGVGLAPVAAIVVLIGGSGGAIRFAVLLIAVCVVVLGASLLIRNDPVLLHMHVEERVGAEADAIREELRGEFAAAARVTHHRVQTLQDEIDRLRGASPVPVPAVAVARPEPAPATGGRAVAAATAADPAYPRGGGRASATPGRAEPHTPPGHVTGGRAVAAAQGNTSPGQSTGGRAIVVASSPGWPEPSPPTRRSGPIQPMAGGPIRPAGGGPGPAGGPAQPVGPGQPDGRGGPSRPPGRVGQGQPAGGRAVVGAASASIPARPAGSGEVPRQRGAGVAPPPAMTPVFRPPMAPHGPGAGAGSLPERGQRAGAERGFGPGEGTGSTRPAGPARGPHSEPWPADAEPAYGPEPAYGLGYGAEPGYDPHGGYNGTSGYEGTPGYDGPAGYDGTPGYDGPAGYDETPGYDGPAGYGDAPDWGNDQPEPHDDQAGRSGRRRADVTATDLGYTGRRSRPDDDVEEGFDFGSDTGYPGYGDGDPELYGPDPRADDYDGRRW